MSFADPASLQLFELLAGLLSQLSSEHNQVRKAAEDQLNNHWLVNQPGPLLAGLAYLTANSPDLNVRNFSPVLLRRIALREAKESTIIELVGDHVRSSVQENLLKSLSTEPESSVRNKVCDTVAQIAEHLLLRGSSWDELVTATLSFASSPNAVLRKTAFLVVSGVPSLYVRHNPATLASLFNSGAQDPEMSVRLACVKAAIYYLLHTEQDARNAMAGLVPLLLNIIPPVMADTAHEDNAVECLGYFIELAESYPKLFKSVIAEVVAFMTQQMQNKELEDGTRQTCLELLLTLTENAPGLMRKYQPFGPTVIPIILEWMSELEDEPEWYNRDNSDDDDQDTNETAGEQAMDRLAIYLGGKIVLPVAFSHIPALVASPEWQRRHAGLRCISAIGEGCHKLMEAELEKVINVVIPHLRDPHPRVRHAACNAIGQMCTDFAPNIQNRFHERILANLIPVMDDPQYLRVASYGAAAMVNFSENAREIIAPYLESIIPKLLNLMNTGKVFAQEQSITTLATVADSAGAEFSKYYSSIMPVLLNFLQNARDKELRSLRGKTLECASLVALAVGKDVFQQHAHQFIHLLQETQQSVTDPDDPQSSYLLSAWARVCKVLGTEFAPYLDVILPPLVASAQLKPDVVAFGEDEEIGDQYTEEEGWEMLQLSGKRIGIKTSVLEEKCTAVEMLVCYVQEMGALFHPYVQSTTELVLPMLKFYFHDGVRFAACSVIPLLVKSWVLANYPQQQIGALFQSVAAKIFDAMNDETDIALVGQFFATFADSHDAAGFQSMTPELLNQFTLQCQKHLQSYFERMAERADTRAQPDYDPEDEDALVDDEYNDENLLDEIAKGIHTLFKYYKSAFLPYFDQLLPAINHFLVSAESSARQWALCVYCDVIEFTGQDSGRYSHHFLNAIASGISDPSADIRQSAAYGVGVAALFGTTLYTDLCREAVPHLFAAVNAPDSREDDNILATENCIAAIGKICKAYKDANLFDYNQAVGAWFQTLPIIEDSEEAAFVYGYLLDLIDSHHPSVVSQEFAHLQKLVHVITQVLVRPSLLTGHEAITARLVKSLGSLLAQCDQNTRASLWTGLSPETQSFLTSKGYV
ncbi:armadillo-type protein [Gorgonomyces haynaldii]|nr:armadillo-type protein [Gorgonomyces haynaldii]